MQDPITTTVTVATGDTMSLDLYRDNRVTVWRVEGGGRIWCGERCWSGETLVWLGLCHDFSNADRDLIDEALVELDLRGV